MLFLWFWAFSISMNLYYAFFTSRWFCFSCINITAGLLIQRTYAYLESLVIFLLVSAFPKHLKIVSNSFNQIECCNFLPSLPKQVFLMFFFAYTLFSKSSTIYRSAFQFWIFFPNFYSIYKISFSSKIFWTLFWTCWLVSPINYFLCIRGDQKKNWTMLCSFYIPACTVVQTVFFYIVMEIFSSIRNNNFFGTNWGRSFWERKKFWIKMFPFILEDFNLELFQCNYRFFLV